MSGPFHYFGKNNFGQDLQDITGLKLQNIMNNKLYFVKA